MNSALYTRYAHYYEAISNDRDFNKEITVIKRIMNKDNRSEKLSILELFAGPAAHSIAAQKQLKGAIYAIDNSNEMRNIALKKGFSKGENYCVGDLPNSLDLLPNDILFDGITCLRFSLCYLDIESAYTLLNRLKSKLTESGKIFIELHKIGKVIGNMNSTEIRERTTFIAETKEEITCVWPHGNVLWQEDSYQAKMNIHLKIKDEKDRVEEINLSSEEHIHSLELISFLAKISELKCRLISSKYGAEILNGQFENSLLMEISK